MEFKYVPLQDSLQIDDERTVKSIFAVTGNADQVGDIIHPGAFAKTAAEGLAAGNIKVLWQHDASAPPIGTLVDLKEVKQRDLPEAMRAAYPEANGGLLGVWKALDTPRGNEVLAGIKAGAITQNSIGFDIVKWDVDQQGSGKSAAPVRNLREVRLWDVSPVVWGANPATANVKSAEDRITEALDALALDLKVGAVLSASNKEKLQTAIEALQALLAAAEPPKADDTAKALTARIVMQRIATLERELLLAG